VPLPGTAVPARARTETGAEVDDGPPLTTVLGFQSRHEPISLFGEILDWLLAPLLLLWPLSLAVTWTVAQTIANRPYDRELAEVAMAVARQAQRPRAPHARESTAVRGELERAASAMLRLDDADQLYFQVLGPRGEFVAGDASLPVPTDGRPVTGAVQYRDDMLAGTPVRVAYLRLQTTPPGDGAESLVQVAETLNKRSQLATDIVKGVILPQFLILPLAVMLVFLALARGIRPLADLQQRIRGRDSTDLSPIPQHDVPEEVAPLVDAINDLLQRLDKTIATQRHFLADAAHQLKTPLAGLRMQAELVAREIDSGQADPRSVRLSLLQIALSSERAAHMVNQLLALARAEHSGSLMRAVPVDLAEVTRHAVQDFVPRALELGVDLGYEGPGDGVLPSGGDASLAEVYGDAVLLGEVVRNLVDNALHYTPVGGQVTARVRPDAFGEALLLQVEDSGPGIEPAEREHVFRPFYRTLGTGVEGSGLGLAIVQEIAERHGATVTVSDARARHGPASQPPGALFTVRFAPASQQGTGWRQGG